MSKPRGKSTTKSRDKGGRDKQEDAAPEKSSPLSFTILSKPDTESVLNMTVLETESKLQEIFKLNPMTDLKDAAILDYYVSAVHWGKEQGFTATQLSGFFTLIYTLLNKIKDEHMAVVDLMMEFRKMLIGIGTPPNTNIAKGGLECFDTDQAKAITDYLYTSLFQHYKLYEFMFTQQQDEEIVTFDLSVEVPLAAETPFPPPLDEGITEEIYRNFLSIPTPSLSETADETGAVEESGAKTVTPIEVELPPEAEDLFCKLTPEDVRSIIEDVSAEFLNSLQLGVENKMRNQENQVLTRINKVHNVLPHHGVDTSQDHVK